MDDDKTHNIGVKEETLRKAREDIHYNCRPCDWQMFEILFTFCKHHPDEFLRWKIDKLEKIKKQWKKKSKK